VFETPGTYLVTLTVVDGTNSVSNACVQITVQDPEVVFAGANTICFSTSGTFTQAPCNAPGTVTITTSNFVTAIGNAAPGKRLLFRRGETWTAATAASLRAAGPGIVGAYGAGAAPIVRSTGNTTMLALSSASTPNIGDWRVMDLEFDGLGGAGSNGVIGNGGANQMTLLRLRIHDASNGIQFSSSILDFWNNNGSPGHVLWDQIAIVDSTIQRVIGGSGGNGMFLLASRLGLLGNTVDDTTAAEHNIRIQYASKGVVQANDAGLPAVTKHNFTLRGVTAVNAGVTGTGTTQMVVISENLFRGGLSSEPVALRPSAASEDERIRDIIFERNLLRAGSAVQTGFNSSADEVTVRNNIFDMTASGGRCMTFNLRGAEPPHREIRVYNNTCFSNGTGSVHVVSLDATNTNVTIKNNLGYAPNSTPASIFLSNAGSTNVIGGGGTFGNSSDININNTSPNFANNGTCSNAGAFALNAPSYALNTGVAVPVFSDICGVSRPQGGSIDIGAAERP